MPPLERLAERMLLQFVRVELAQARKEMRLLRGQAKDLILRSRYVSRLVSRQGPNSLALPEEN